MSPSEPYIDNDAELVAYLDSIAATRTLALDTEFVREKTYFPRLCLIQIATPGTIACVDCLAKLDLATMFERLTRADSEWIAHSSRQDLEVIHQHASRLPAGLIDTQIAAGLIGYPPQVGLQELLEKLLGIELAKEYTRTDWSRRPLPQAALAYARDDVRSLGALWTALAARLEELGRRRWLEQDCALLIAQPPTVSPEQVWLRLRGVRALDAESRAVALALVNWRERRARARNRPRRWILGDEPLVAIARAAPASVDALRRVPDLPPRLTERLGDEVLAAISAADEPEYRKRAESLARAEQPDKRRLRALRDAAGKRAKALGVHPEVLATKQELADALCGRASPRIAATWRAGVLGDLLGAQT